MWRWADALGGLLIGDPPLLLWPLMLWVLCALLLWALVPWALTVRR